LLYDFANRMFDRLENPFFPDMARSDLERIAKK
jgi:hypothetical protein